MLDAVKFGHESFVPVIEAIEKLAKKAGKPHNIGAILFFFPGYGVTLKNIEEATVAARERALHLNKLKEKKGC